MPDIVSAEFKLFLRETLEGALSKSENLWQQRFDGLDERISTLEQAERDQQTATRIKVEQRGFRFKLWHLAILALASVFGALLESWIKHNVW